MVLVVVVVVGFNWSLPDRQTGGECFIYSAVGSSHHQIIASLWASVPSIFELFICLYFDVFNLGLTSPNGQLNLMPSIET